MLHKVSQSTFGSSQMKALRKRLILKLHKVNGTITLTVILIQGYRQQRQRVSYHWAVESKILEYAHRRTGIRNSISKQK